MRINTKSSKVMAASRPASSKAIEKLATVEEPIESKKLSEVRAGDILVLSEPNVVPTNYGSGKNLGYQSYPAGTIIFVGFPGYIPSYDNPTIVLSGITGSSAGYFNDMAKSERMANSIQNIVFGRTPKHSSKETKFNLLPAKQEAKVRAAIISNRILTDSNGYSRLLVKTLIDSTGADPEVFAVDKAGEMIPAFTFLDSKPGIMVDKGQGYIYNDGFQAEFAPYRNSCHARLSYSFWTCLTAISNAVKSLDYNARLVHNSVLPVPPHMLAGASDAQIALGCAPSLNAYGEPNTEVLMTLEPRTLPVRFAGCHFHYGSEVLKKLPEDKLARLVRLIDSIAGVASVSILRGLEDPIRRRYYGRAGEYRRPAHGLEYRVFSSAALVSPAITHLLLDLSRAALSMGLLRLETEFDLGDPIEVQDIINNLDIGQAVRHLKEREELIGALLRACYGQCDARKRALRLIFEGAFGLIPTRSLNENWGLHKNSYSAYDSTNNSVATLRLSR